MKTITRKILIIFLVVVILFNSLILPQKAEAFLGVGDVSWDPGNWVANLGTWLEEAAGWLWEEAKWAWEKLQPSLRDAVSKRIIDYIVDQTVEWVQGGGEPKFVTDWQGFLKDAGNIAFDQVIKDVGLAWLCDPFSLQVKISLLPVPKFSRRIECTLDDVVQNIEAFYEDFENGGWIAYQETWYPQNNYFGLMMMTHDETLIKTAQKTEAAANEALAGKGFLSVKNCVLYDEDTGECLKETIVTPGDTVGQVIARGVTSDIEWASNIQSWTSALVNAVINRLVKEGVGLIKPSPESPDVYYPPEYQGGKDEELERSRNDLIAKYEKFLNALNEMITFEEKSLSLSQELLSTYETINNYICTPLIPQSKISTVQADIDKASSLLTQYVDLAIEINERLDELYSLTSVDVGQLQQALWESNDFFNTHTDLFIDLTATGLLKDELTTVEIPRKQRDLNSAKSQLEGCLPPSPPPTSTSTSENQP